KNEGITTVAVVERDGAIGGGSQSNATGANGAGGRSGRWKEGDSAFFNSDGGGGLGAGCGNVVSGGREIAVSTDNARGENRITAVDPGSRRGSAIDARGPIGTGGVPGLLGVQIGGGHSAVGRAVVVEVQSRRRSAIGVDQCSSKQP